MTPPRRRPVRAGVLGLWDYRDQEFAFADGRLVLRGPNGSGKTKALEVLFPFVLDGRLDPYRLDPFSGQDRTMRDNLLWREGGKVGWGYAWMEFAGPGLDPITIGVGLRARREGTGTDSWFFVASGRRGRDFELVDGEHRPLARRRLAEALGDEAVFERARDYRQAVSAALFGLEADRYEAMLDLVLTLRRPQLAKGLDPQRLSEVLSDGLRPLDRALLESASRAFEDLEQVQLGLERLQQAKRVIDQLITTYRTYLRCLGAARLADWRTRAGALGALREDLQGLAQEIARGQDHCEALVAALGRADQDQADRVGERDGLRQSAAFRAAEELDELRGRVGDARKVQARAQGACDKTLAALKRRQDERDTEAHRVETARSEVGVRNQDVQGAALEARVKLLLPDEEVALPEARERTLPRVAARRVQVDAVLVGLAAWEEALTERVRERERADESEGLWEDAAGQAEEAREGLASARQLLEESLERWWGVLPEGWGLPSLRASLAVAVETLATGEGGDLRAAVHEGWQTGRQDLARRIAESRGAVSEVRLELEDLDARIGRVTSEQEDAPLPVPWRPAPRVDRPGAPLWRLVRFAEDLDEGSRAGLEGALEASGLLDAWLTPDGQVPADIQDAFLAPGPAVQGQPSLADLLVAEDQDLVPQGTVRGLLLSIPLGRVGPVGLSSDGHYSLGPLRGAARPQAPRYVGATARAAHRRRRLEELRAVRQTLAERLSGLVLQVQAAEALEQRLEDHLGDLPAPTALRQAVRIFAAAATRAEDRERDLRRARRRVQAADASVADGLAALRALARRHATPAEPGPLRALSGAVDALSAALDAWLVSREHLVGARRVLGQSQGRLDEALAQAGEARQELAAAVGRYQELRARLVAIEQALGEDVRRVLARLEDLERTLETQELALLAQRGACREAEDALVDRRGVLTGRREGLASLEDQAAASRARLEVFGATDVGSVLALEPGLELPEALARAVDGAAWAVDRQKATQTALENRLHALDGELGADYRSTFRVADDLYRVDLEDAEGHHELVPFGRRVAERVGHQETLLTVHERAVFEDQLLGVLCGQLRERTHAARELVEGMDRAMRDKRLSSGHRVGITWALHEDGSEERRAVLGLLDRAPEHHGAVALQRIRAYFAAEVQAARRAAPERPFEGILREALDYRRWHEFRLWLHESGGGRHRLTRRRHGRLSGGEKAAALHLPLFAAANAHFDSAEPHCPRLVALDEAFAGIDRTGRPELLRLAVEFRLDLFMTGHDLWAVEACVPGVMHYDLMHDRAEGVVSAIPVLWTGRELVEGAAAEAAVVGDL